MGRKSKFSAEEKRYICRQLEQGGSTIATAKGFGIGETTLRQWCLEFRYHGDSAFERASGNRTYTVAFKQLLMEEYYLTGISCFELGAKYQISNSVIAGWIQSWDNGDEITDYHLHPGVYTMSSKTTTVAERKEIIQWVLDHDMNYRAAAARFGIKYATVYRWTRSYLKEGEASLHKKRGRKPVAEIDLTALTELERLKLDYDRLQKENHRLDLENRILKKKEELLARRRSQT